jgi:hypothetical protein
MYCSACPPSAQNGERRGGGPRYNPLFDRPQALVLPGLGVCCQRKMRSIPAQGWQARPSLDAYLDALPEPRERKNERLRGANSRLRSACVGVFGVSVNQVFRLVQKFVMVGHAL